VWLKDAQLSDNEVVTAFRLMGGTVSFQLLAGLYSSALIGLSRLGTMSILTVLGAIVKNVGALIILQVFAPSAQNFFSWLLISMLVQAALMRAAVYHSLPAARSDARFNPAILAKVYHFAFGMGAIAILSTAIQNVDKIVLVKVVPLSVFALYSLSNTFSSILTLLATAVYMLAIPRITAMIGNGLRTDLDQYFARISDILCLLVCPTGAVLIVLAEECLVIATGDRMLAGQAEWLLRLISLAALVNAFAWLPYALVIGEGTTRPVLKLLLIGACIITPAVILASLWAGALGSAVMIIIFQTFNLVGHVWIAASRGLLRQLRSWVLHNVFGVNIFSLLTTYWINSTLTVADDRLHVVVEVFYCYIASFAVVSCYLVALRCQLALPAMWNLIIRVRCIGRSAGPCAPPRLAGAAAPAPRHRGS
jgi:O-antigen/teichoic acid export membrane protein